MMRKLILLLFLFTFLAYGQEDELYKKLKALPDVVEVKTMEVDSMFEEGYASIISLTISPSSMKRKGMQPGVGGDRGSWRPYSSAIRSLSSIASSGGRVRIQLSGSI
jgi:hypothetical protein